MKTLATLVLVLSAACRNVPPCRDVSDLGEVRASTERAAHRVLIQAEILAAQASTILHVKPTPFVIELYDYPLGHVGVRVWRDRHGRITDRVVQLGQEAISDHRFFLAHELTHWNAIGVWDRLPIAIHEGMADFVAAQLVPEDWHGPRAQQELTVALQGVHLAELSASKQITWHRQPKAVKSEAYPFGHFLTERITVHGLLELCQQAEREGLEFVPMERVLLRAGIEPNQEAVNEAMRVWAEDKLKSDAQ